jgi:heptosyltransferase-2
VSPRRALTDGLFALGWRLLGPIRERRRRELVAGGTSPRRIVVVTPVFGIGNLVLLSGLLANLRRLYPQAYLALAVPPAEHVRSLIGEELADEIVPFDPRSRRRALRFAWEELRPRRFDLGLATFFLPTVDVSGLLVLAGCRHRIAFAADEHRGLLNTVTCIDKGGHELDRHLQLLAFSGRPLERSTRVSPSPDAVRWAEGTLRRLGLGDVRNLVGVHPGCESVNAQKRWPAGRFGEVIRRLVASDDVGVLLFLGPGEADLLPALDLPASRRIHVVAGESLARVIALVARCDALLSNDSGLMHVAAGLGVPVAAIFGPTPVEKNAPVGRATILEEAGLWCRPCWAGPPLSCHRERRYCLEGVGVDEVLAATRALLRTSSARAAEPRAS